jgi:hypothetical protein
MKPLRPFLLNEQIAVQARKIAHGATPTCRGELTPNHNDHHTLKCNKLKGEIEELARQIKLAGLQGR